MIWLRRLFKIKKDMTIQLGKNDILTIQIQGKPTQWDIEEANRILLLIFKGTKLFLIPSWFIITVVTK